MADLLGLDSLVAQLILVLGLALIAGNGWAWIQHARGIKPKGAEGEFRASRVMFLLGVGVVLSAWGLASLL